MGQAAYLQTAALSDLDDAVAVFFGRRAQSGKPIEGDLENQLKTGERRLKEFKEYQGKKEFLKENNWTEEEYERFLKQKLTRLSGIGSIESSFALEQVKYTNVLPLA